MKSRVHITLPDVLLEPLQALAELRGQSLSDLLEDIVRKELEARGITPELTAEVILRRLADKAEAAVRARGKAPSRRKAA
jgi:hypothetical protein